MKTLESAQRNERVASTIHHWLHKIPWQWSADICFPKNADYYRLMTLFLRQIRTEDHLQTCAAGVWVDSDIKGRHMHAFLYGYSSKSGKTLRDSDFEYWKLFLPGLTHKSNAIVSLPSQEDIDAKIQYSVSQRNYQEQQVVINGKLHTEQLPPQIEIFGKNNFKTLQNLYGAAPLLK